MIIIQDNPEQVIPQICERDAQEKTILVELFGNCSHKTYIGILVKIDDKYCFRGGNLFDILQGSNYFFNFNEPDQGKDGLYQIILHIYNIHMKRNLFKVKFYIFENSHEIFEYMKDKGIS